MIQIGKMKKEDKPYYTSTFSFRNKENTYTNSTSSLPFLNVEIKNNKSNESDKNFLIRYDKYIKK